MRSLVVAKVSEIKTCASVLSDGKVVQINIPVEAINSYAFAQFTPEQARYFQKLLGDCIEACEAGAVYPPEGTT